ncbi:hypothetical protein ACFYXM_24020 [Streptomyces sp. NPDC002476]|uniref:hypothetical protein n=1 Tax=Streptomyces sp. NPDC002476 TaxID=3364648 RepID=UPI0036A152FF
MPTDVDAGRSGLDLGDGWTRRWTVSWRAGGDDASCSVHDLVQEPVLTSESGQRKIPVGGQISSFSADS